MENILETATIWENIYSLLQESFRMFNIPKEYQSVAVYILWNQSTFNFNKFLLSYNKKA